MKFWKNNLDSLQKNSGTWALVVLSIIPILIWVFMKPIGTRFSSEFAVFKSLGQVTGLLGMALLSLNFVLSARFKFLDKIFNGLNKVYEKHYIVGALSFALLLFHPTFLIVQYLTISVKAAFNFAFLSQSTGLFLGKSALAVFILLMIITFYLKLKYQNWKKTHQFLGIVLFLGWLHMLFVPTDISNNILLKIYMILLAAVGVYSYLYRTIFAVYKKGLYKYRLNEVLKLNDSVFELKLSPVGNKMSFDSGQFVFIKFDLKGEMSEVHPFSISSSSSDSNISLGIKSLGDFTSLISQVPLGTECLLEGPFGKFSYQNVVSKNQIWIAGGIGITPFLGMVRDLNNKGFGDYKISLFYSVKNQNEAVFADEIQKIADNNQNFKFKLHLTEKEGFITAEKTKANNPDFLDSEIFLCGPPIFMKSLRDQFVDLGFKNNLIHSEEFNFN